MRGQARYEQIASHLMALIEEGSPGDRLPSEAELCEQFKVSRMTARQAMQSVASRGLIERRRGAGSFIKASQVPRQLGSPLSFSGSMQARGMEASSQTLDKGLVTPTEDERTALDLDPGVEAYALERLRLGDEVPMAIERVVMPVELADSLSEGFEHGSLHDAFRAVGSRPSHAHSEVSARRATKRQRELLDLTQSGIVIVELKTIFDQAGSPMERTSTSYAADRYVFRAVLQAPADMT